MSILRKKQSEKLQIKQKKKMDKIKLLLALSMSIVIWIGSGNFSFIQAAPSVERLWGQSQYDTAKTIGEKISTSPENVVLASGRGFADALAASVLAYKLDAPILLVEKDPADSAAAINYVNSYLRAKGTVWIIGGQAVINGNFDKQLSGKGYTVNRLGGYDQYETSALVAGAEKMVAGTPVVIASGDRFPDALSFSSIAARKGWPVLLVSRDYLSGQVKDFLAGLKPSQIYIAGGTGAIGSAVESGIRNACPAAAVERFAGFDMYDTAALILDKFAPQPDTLYIASGNNFPDALSGSVLAAKNNAPIMLVDSNSTMPPAAFAPYLSNLKSGKVVVLGGQAVVSPSLANNVAGAIGQPLATSEFSFYNLALGSTENAVIGKLGQPQRKDLSEYGFQWYIYNSDYKNYLQVGMQNGKVVAIYTCADNWASKNGIKTGTARTAVDKAYSKAGKSIGLPNNSGYETYLVENNYTTLFYDTLNSSTVTGVQVLDKAVADSFKSYYGTPSDQLKSGYEREISDLANVIRVRNGLTAMEWNDTIAGTARKHSADMAANNYFSHTNLQGLSPFDRMKKDGINYRLAAENIAGGQTSGIFAHHGWMNSSGHRSNILGGCTRLGVGVAFGGEYSIYYTQNFYTPL